MKKGDVVKVVKQSTKFNAHIRNVGYIGVVDDLHETAVQLDIFWDSEMHKGIGGGGAVDIDCVKVLDIEQDLTHEQRCTLKANWVWKRYNDEG